MMLKSTLFSEILYFHDLLNCLKRLDNLGGACRILRGSNTRRGRADKNSRRSSIFILARERDSARTRDGVIKIVCFRMRHRLVKTGRVYPPPTRVLLHPRLTWSVRSFTANVSYAISHERVTQPGSDVSRTCLKSDDPSFFSAVR